MNHDSAVSVLVHWASLRGSTALAVWALRTIAPGWYEALAVDQRVGVAGRVGHGLAAGRLRVGETRRAVGGEEGEGGGHRGPTGSPAHVETSRKVERSAIAPLL